MTYGSLALILTSVLLSSVAQLLLKFGMSRTGASSATPMESPLQLIAAAIMSPGVIVGLSLYALGAIVWLLVLARVDVSVAYPLFSLGFLLTMLLAVVFLGEQVSLLRVGGTLLIVAGCALVAGSA